MNHTHRSSSRDLRVWFPAERSASARTPVGRRQIRRLRDFLDRAWRDSRLVGESVSSNRRSGALPAPLQSRTSGRIRVRRQDIPTASITSLQPGAAEDADGLSGAYAVAHPRHAGWAARVGEAAARTRHRLRQERAPPRERAKLRVVGLPERCANRYPARFSCGQRNGSLPARSALHPGFSLPRLRRAGVVRSTSRSGAIVNCSRTCSATSS